MMPNNSRTTSSGPYSPYSHSISRLRNLADHMAPASVTSFPAEAVPQAPEDPLFGLMRAFRADESKNKVDLVCRESLTACDSQLVD
jgi:aspartate aminotransferase, cytoplasmic